MLQLFSIALIFQLAFGSLPSISFAQEANVEGLQAELTTETEVEVNEEATVETENTSNTVDPFRSRGS